MTDETGASAGGEAIAADLPADAPEEFASVNDAAEYFAGLQEKRKNPPAESAEVATAENESPVEGDAAPEKVPGENADADPEEKLPPIDRPRAWSKEDDDWDALPRSRQEKIAANERAREADHNQKIAKVADATKALEAKAAQAEQAIQQAGQHAKAALAVLEREQLRDFPDIKNIDDIRNLAANDPFRYLQWDAHQKDMVAAQFVAREAEGRQNQEKQKQSFDRKAREHALLIEKAPEFAEAAKLTAAQQAAAQLFRLKGFTDEQLNTIVDENPILDDHRMQLIINDASKYYDIIAAKIAVSAKTLPPVQRPGASKPLGQNANSERIQALNRKPELTIKEATELYTLQQSSQRRAS